MAAADGEATIAFNSLNQGVGTVLPASLNLANGTGIITPGIYTFLGGAAILPANTTVTFNGPGIYVLRTASTLDMVSTAGTPNTNMLLINGANACDIYWQVGSAATIEAQPGRQFVGQVFASAAATVTAGNVTGRIISTNAAATMSNGGNTIGGCAVAGAPPVPALPGAATLGLLGVLLAAGVFVLARR